MARVIDLSGMSPPAAFSQPPVNVLPPVGDGGVRTFFPPWLYFDVTSVTSP